MFIFRLFSFQMAQINVKGIVNIKWLMKVYLKLWDSEVSGVQAVQTRKFLLFVESTT